MVLLSSGATQHARAADPDQVLVPYAQYSILYDDNLLRVRDAAAAQAALGDTQMSDVVRTSLVGMRFNRLFSRQRISLDASLNKSQLEHYTQFNNQGRNANGNWSWVLGDQLSGDIGYVYSQALTPFQNLRVLEKNMRTLQTKYATAAWQMHPDWRLRGQVSRFSLDYDLASQSANGFTQNLAEVGVDYVAKSGSTAGVQVTRTSANYPNNTFLNGELINNSFTQDDVKLKVLWLYSGKTKLQFLGGLARRERNVSTGAGNFQGFNARLAGEWAATGKTLFKLNLWREISGISDVDANFSLTTGLSLGGTLAASEKLRFDGLLDFERRNYNGAAVVTGVTPSNRKDNYQKEVFSVTYLPTTSLSLVAAIYRESSQSNIVGYGYVSNGVSLTTRYEF